MRNKYCKNIRGAFLHESLQIGMTQHVLNIFFYRRSLTQILKQLEILNIAWIYTIIPKSVLQILCDGPFKQSDGGCKPPYNMLFYQAVTAQTFWIPQVRLSFDSSKSFIFRSVRDKVSVHRDTSVKLHIVVQLCK
jgi:hypothetical protein